MFHLVNYKIYHIIYNSIEELVNMYVMYLYRERKSVSGPSYTRFLQDRQTESLLSFRRMNF